MVGKTGFEPATPWSQTKCSTKLSHFPIYGALEGIRTPDLLVRSQTLYPAELRAHSQIFFGHLIPTQLIIPYIFTLVNHFLKFLLTISTSLVICSILDIILFAFTSSTPSFEVERCVSSSFIVKLDVKNVVKLLSILY